MSLIGKVIGYFLERRARGKDYDALIALLEGARGRVAARFAAAADTPRNRAQANHIIGIERWAQRRLRTLLGEPLIMDEYDAYRPGEDKSMAELSALFDETRTESIRLLQSLQQAALPVTKTAPHNDSGPLSIAAWAIYLAGHASRESILLRSS